MPEIHLRQLGFTIVLVDRLQKTKKYKNLKKQDIYDPFIKTNLIKLVFNMTWFMEILKI